MSVSIELTPSAVKPISWVGLMALSYVFADIYHVSLFHASMVMLATHAVYTILHGFCGGFWRWFPKRIAEKIEQKQNTLPPARLLHLPSFDVACPICHSEPAYLVMTGSISCIKCGGELSTDHFPTEELSNGTH